MPLKGRMIAEGQRVKQPQKLQCIQSQYAWHWYTVGKYVSISPSDKILHGLNALIASLSSDLTALLGQSSFKPFLGPGYFLLW